MKRDDKRGQFYLIAAIIVIAVLIALATVGNYAFSRGSKESIKIYELSKDLQLEGESVINHGVFQGDPELELERFTQDYGEYISAGDTDVYFVFGDQEMVNIRGYVNAVVGSIGLNIGGTITEIDIQGNYVTDDDIIVTGQANVVVEVGGKSYPFDLKKGENFFFVIQQPLGSGGQIGGSNTDLE
jgi:hypothetical protein